MTRYWLGMAMLLGCAAAVAAGPGAVRKQVESSMLVTGKIHVDSAGSVSGYSLYQEEKLPPGIVTMVNKYVPGWKFEPVLIDGKPVNATTDMSIRFVAKKIDADNYSIEIRSAGFGDRADRHWEAAKRVNPAPGTCPSLAPPQYPQAAARAGVAANVYMVVKASPEGKVLEAVAEQVNLKAVSDERTMQRWRRVFADVSVRQAKSWCFTPSKDGDDPGAEFQVLRVPVVFSLDKLPAYGSWEAYVPGPRQSSPWKKDSEGTAFSPDALPPGGAYLAGSGLRLLSKLPGG